MSLRERDHKTEENIGVFLDRHFYPRLKLDTRIKSTIRVTSVEEQRNGIDIKYITETEEFLVDEKVASNYTKRLDKFALELSSIQGGKEIEGWLTSEVFKNDFYLFGWIDVVDKLVKGILIDAHTTVEVEDIKSIDVMIVSKRAILEYLESLGYTKLYLKVLNKAVRANKVKLEEGKYLRKKDYDNKLIDFHFTFSSIKKEKPFMINLRKSLIERLSYYSYEVREDDCIKLKG